MMSRCSRPRLSSGSMRGAGACAKTANESTVTQMAAVAVTVRFMNPSSSNLALFRPVLNIENAGAVSELLCRHAHLVQHRRQQIRHARVLRKLQVPSPLQLSRRGAGQHDRQRTEVVLVTVTEGAAVEHQRVIEQRAVAVRRLLQPKDEIGELRDMV